jgi:hypothetical protein
MELRKSFDAEQYAEGLESWSAIDFRGKSPVLTSLFGDLFFASEDGYWFLDVVTGELTPAFGVSRRYGSRLALPNACERYLLASVAAAASELRMSPWANRLVVTINISAQILTQIKDLPAGTPVSGFAKTDPGRGTRLLAGEPGPRSAGS